MDTALGEHRKLSKLFTHVTLSQIDEERHHHLIQFADLLTQHIRFEERVLFPMIEKVLSSAELDQVGKELAQSKA